MRASVARVLESPANKINPARPMLEGNILRLGVEENRKRPGILKRKIWLLFECGMRMNRDWRGTDFT